MSTWPSAATHTITWSSSSARTSTAAVIPASRRRTSATAACTSSSPRRSDPSRRSTSGPSGGSRGRRPRPRAGRRRVEHRAGDLGLRGALDVAIGLRGDDRDLVVLALEADVGAGDVVDHDRVEPLASELVAPVRDRVLPVLGGEADDRLARAPAGGQRRQHVGGRLERERQLVAVGLLDLAGDGRGGTEVGDRGGHEQHVGAGERRLAGRLQLGGRSRRRRSGRGGRAGSATLAATTVTSAPSAAAASASAKPMRPDERLPTKRTASIGSRVPPAVTRTRSPTRWREAAAGTPASPRGSPARADSTAASTAASSSAGSASRPAPCSPLEASAPTPGSSTVTPRPRSVARLACVAGCSHMWLFIAGATTTGQVAASAALVSRLSARPWASLAIVLALAGATTRTSALRTSSRWLIGSWSGAG